MSTTCLDCDSTKIHVRGRCRRCYQREYMRERRRLANPYLLTWETDRLGHKICRRCERELPLDDFGKRKTGKNGLSSWCRECIREHSRIKRESNPLARQREREYEQRPDVAARIKAKNAAREYGISSEQFQSMRDRQNGRCAVCQRERKLAIDHCHTSKQVRELLCYPCNIALGQVNDNVELLQQLINYVQRHRKITTLVSP